MDPTIWIVAFGIVAAVVFGIVRGRQRRQEMARRVEALRADAGSRGWQFESQRRGRGSFLRFSGKTGGVTWSFDVQHEPGTESDTADDYSRWRTDSVSLPGAVVLLVPKLRNAIQFGALSAGQGKGGNMLTQVALRAFIKNVLHDDPAEAREFEYARPVQAGSDALRESYMVMSTGESNASQFLGKEAETALLAYSSGDDYNVEARIGAVIFWKSGLSVSFTRSVLDPEEIAEIARFGAALAGRG